MAFFIGLVGLKHSLEKHPLRSFVLVCQGVLVLTFLIYVFWQAHAFNTMTSGTHLAEAREELKQRDFSEALRHIDAIPSNTPEAEQAKTIKNELIAEQLANAVRGTTVRDLQATLKNFGYDLNVESRSDKPDQIVITSKDFVDTERRVRFLAFMRGARSPLYGVCASGFQTLRLEGSGLLSRFSEEYSLDCFTQK